MLRPPRPIASRAAAVAALAVSLVFPAAASAGRAGLSANPKSGAVSISLPGAKLVESPSARVAVRVDGLWREARRLVRRSGPAGAKGSGTLRLRLATGGPSGARIQLELTRTRAGQVLGTARALRAAGRVTGVRIGFRARRGERMLGFGERSDHVDQRGNEVESFVGEGPYLEPDYPVIASSVPEWGRHQRSDATYYPIPWLLSTEGYGFLIRNPQTSRFDLASSRRSTWTAEVDAPRLDFRVFPGPRPADALESMSDAVGRQPAPAAPWLFGPWFQTGHSNTEPDELEFARTLREADAPVSAVETHMRYMPCGSDLGAEASEAARTAAFRELGLATLSYTREAICASYVGPFQDAAARGGFLKRPDGSPYLFDAFVGSGVTQLGMIDFTDPDGRRVYESILDRAYAAGYDGWMEDYGEYAPPDARTTNGPNGSRLHNRYPELYHRAGFEYAESKRRPIVRFNRSGFTRAARHSQIVWGGDPTTGWDFDGLASAVKEGLTMGLSGVSLWGSDIGGFFSLTGPRLDEELLARWIQFGAFSGVMRSKAEGIGDTLENRPQVWEQPTLPVWRRYAKLRTQLYPYLVAADREYRKTGMPIMRHLALLAPGDRRATGVEDQYMFGPSLMVAPVIAPGATSRDVYLPKGRWIDFWAAVGYGEAGGTFDLGRARAVAGRRTHEAAAPLDTIPLYARAGAMLPMLPADTETLAPYGKAAHTGLDDSRGELHVIAFPRGRSTAAFGGSGRLRSRELDRGWAFALSRGPKRLKLDLEASTSTLKRPFVPRYVTLDGRALRRGWSYDRRTHVLRVEVRVKPGSVIRALPSAPRPQRSR